MSTDTEGPAPRWTRPLDRLPSIRAKLGSVIVFAVAVTILIMYLTVGFALRKKEQGQQFLILLPDGRLHVLPEYPGDFRWRDPNVNATVVTLGVWHRVEWYCQLATGTLKWWLDGVLQGSYSDVRNANSFDQFEFSPTWGGNSGARKAETDHYWFDHVHLSVR